MGRILKMNFSDRNLKGQVIFCVRVVRYVSAAFLVAWVEHSLIDFTIHN